MLLKDRMTPEIKEKMKHSIKLTIETGNEHSFFICKDEKENLSSTSITKGVPTKIEMGPAICPYKTQGNFHTHPDVSNIRRFIFKDREISREVAKEIAIRLAEKEGISITTPSHPDLLSALLNKCFRRTEGTVCVGSDADPNHVSCWTAKEESLKKCEDAIFRFELERKKHDPPKEWIKPLFDKETIYLNNQTFK